MKTEKDIYDQEVERLTNEPALIHISWMFSQPLFAFAKILDRDSSPGCGCLTQIRGIGDRVEIHPDIDDELTEAIRADKRIPISGTEITVESLPVFAEWQRKLDVYREKYKSE